MRRARDKLIFYFKADDYRKENSQTKTKLAAIFVFLVLIDTKPSTKLAASFVTPGYFAWFHKTPRAASFVKYPEANKPCIAPSSCGMKQHQCRRYPDIQFIVECQQRSYCPYFQVLLIFHFTLTFPIVSSSCPTWGHLKVLSAMHRWREASTIMVYKETLVPSMNVPATMMTALITRIIIKTILIEKLMNMP